MCVLSFMAIHSIVKAKKSKDSSSGDHEYFLSWEYTLEPEKQGSLMQQPGQDDKAEHIKNTLSITLRTNTRAAMSVDGSQPKIKDLTERRRCDVCWSEALSPSQMIETDVMTISEVEGKGLSQRIVQGILEELVLYDMKKNHIGRQRKQLISTLLVRWRPLAAVVSIAAPKGGSKETQNQERKGGIWRRSGTDVVLTFNTLRG